MSNKSVEIEILLRETIVEGVKKAKEAIKDLDSGAKDSTVNLKQQIKEQQQLIKEITGDIKALTLAAKEASSPGKKAEILGDLKGAKKALSEEQATLIGMQRQQMDANKNEEASQGGIIASLGKWAIGLASVTAALEIGKSIIGSTMETAEKFEFSIAGASAGLEQFYRNIATGDWSNFFTNIEKAIESGYEFAKVMDEIKKMKWAQEMKESDNELEKFVLLTNLRSKTASPEQRAADGEKYMAIVKGEAKERTDIANAEFEGYKKRAHDITGLDASDVTKILKEVDVTTRLKAEAYNEDIERLKNLRLLSLTAFNAKDVKSGSELGEEAKRLDEELKKVPETVKVYADALTGVGKMKEDFIIGYVNAYKQIGHEEASASKGNLRVAGMITGITEASKKEEEAATKKAKEDAELENRIKATEELLKTAHGAELQRLAEKLTALRKEKKLRDDLINQALMLAQDPTLAGGNGVLPTMTMRSGQPVTSKLALKIDKKQAESDLVDTTKKSIKQIKKDAIPYEKEEEERLKKQHELRLQILNAAMDLTFEIGKQLGLSDDELKIVDETMSAITKVASGDYVGAALSAIMAISDGIAKIIDGGGSDERASRIEKINSLLEEQYNIVQKSAREGQQNEKRQQELDLMKEKSIQLTKNQQEAEDKLQKLNKAGIFWLSGGIVGFLGVLKERKKLKEEISATSEEVKQLESQIKEAEQELLDFQSQGITQNTLADSIAKAFQDGKGSVKDFGEYTNEILREAVLTAFKANVLGDTLTRAQEQIAEAFKDKTLTADEIAGIRSTMQTSTDEAKAKWDALTSAFPEMFSSEKTQATGMTANIKAITEETASTLGGNISAIRINMSRMIESGNTSMGMLQKSLDYQQRTADNTDLMNKTLTEMNSRLTRFEIDGIKVK